MRKLVLQAVGLVVLLVFAQTIFGQDRFILRAPAALLPAIAERHSLVPLSPPNAENVALFTNSDARTPDAVVAELIADPEVQNIEIDRRVSLPESSNASRPDPTDASLQNGSTDQSLTSFFGGKVWSSYANQTATALTRLSDARKVMQPPATGVGIVAVIDTGVDPSQPILQGSLIPGFDFVNGVSGIASEWSDLDQPTAAILNQATSFMPGQDSVLLNVNQSTAAILDQSTAAILDTSHLPAAFGHGTMIAGIIHLIAPTARIMPLKAFRADGSGNLSDIVQAIYYATDNGAQIINMSFSFTSVSTELMKAVNYATVHGVVCVASTGNAGIETMAFPAAFRNVIGVASTNNLDVRSTFSSFGPALTQLAAPGENIITLYPGGYYAIASGTSFSAPFVSGAAALILQVDGDLDATEVFAALSKAKKLTSDLGFGRLDFYGTLRSLIRN